jgi:tungstate transport system ATP-binding protein
MPMPDGSSIAIGDTSDRRMYDDKAGVPVRSSSACVASGLCYDIARRRLIDGIDLTLSERGITAVMGPNGAGKSLLLKLLHGLIEPSAGAVRWGGLPPGPAVRRRQGMVFQRPVLLRRSAGANIDFVLGLNGRATPERRRAALAEVGLDQHERTPARKLSGGEQQRLALARALALEPSVLLLDEATANLDPNSVQSIEAIVSAARGRGIKVVLVTHDVGQARRLSDDVVFIHRGRLIEHRSAADFFAQPASAQARAFLAGQLVL